MDPNTDQTLIFAVGRLEGKVDALLASRDVHDARLTTLEHALDDLRQSRAKLAGILLTFNAASVVAAIVLPLVLHR